MNQLAPDVSLVGEIALGNFQRANTQHIASGNHDFDFGMLKKLCAPPSEEGAQDIHTCVH